jgi:hypothetical protein
MKRPLACLLLCLLLLLPATVFAHPALWVVKDADTTIYLFGTVHLMPKDADWRYPALERALADSQTLYIELTDDNPANIAGLVLRLGMDTAHPLASQLDASEAQRLRILADEAGVPGGMRTLNVMRPWLAALTLSLMPLKNAGLDPEHGVDKQLKAQMIAAHKPVIGLETAEQQIRLLADMPRAMELGLLRSSMRDADQGIGVVPWSPLARGRLARPWEEKPSTVRGGSDPWGDGVYAASKAADKVVVDRVGEVAGRLDVPRPQVALAWLLHQPVVTAPIVGATKPHHLEEAVAALAVELPEAELAALEAPYLPHVVAGID